MLPEVGNFALMLALCMALIQGIVPLLGLYEKRYTWIILARPACWAQLLFVMVAFAILTHAFVINDFSVAYVQAHSNTQLPLIYRVSAVWGAHEGSMLLWILMLSGWTAAVSVFSRRLPESMKALVIAVMGLISVGFLLFLIATSNPFDRLLIELQDKSFMLATEGRSLNPLLQDFGLAIHPPILYMGYVGFSVAFAFAIAALISGRLDATWMRWSRPWTNIAWAFLSTGIVLGSWWAYYELGWGGWWFWDPVENASFMPWLVGTALIHSLAVSEKRGAFKAWTVLLAIFAFSLSLLGTFLVRSGVLTSVHSFASDPERGAFILGFLVFVIGSSLLLFAWRAPRISEGGKFSFLSRETFLLMTNVLFAIAAVVILLGTIFPLITDAFGYKYSVGKPFFNEVFTPLMLPLLMVVAIGPLLRWKKSAELSNAWQLVLFTCFALSLLLIIAGIWLLATNMVDSRNWVLLKLGFVFMSFTIALSAFLALPQKHKKSLKIILLIAFSAGLIFVYPLLDMFWGANTSMTEVAQEAMGLSSTDLIAKIDASVFYLALGVGVGVWVLLATLWNLKSRWGGRLPASYLGMLIAHLGAGVFVLGVSFLANFSLEKEVKLAPNESYELAGYTFTFMGTEAVRGPNYSATRGKLTVKSGSFETIMLPEKRIYDSKSDPMTEAAIEAGFFRDLYVSLGEPLGDGAWNMRVQYKPLVRWVWLGGLMMALGGLVAITDRRYRVAKK